jgi:transposase InsO family protein
MREHGLQPKVRRRFVATTDSDHDSPIFPNLAKDAAPAGPNQLWVSDITYVALPGRFVYVAIILVSRPIILRSISMRPESWSRSRPGPGHDDHAAPAAPAAPARAVQEN